MVAERDIPDASTTLFGVKSRLRLSLLVLFVFVVVIVVVVVVVVVVVMVIISLDSRAYRVDESTEVIPRNSAGSRLTHRLVLRKRRPTCNRSGVLAKSPAKPASPIYVGL